jgi:flagellar protein FliO/FliZ
MTGKTIVVLQETFDINKLMDVTPTLKPEGVLPAGVSDSYNVSQLVGLVFLLIVILVAAYYTSKFLGGIKLGQLKDSNFTLIDTYHISPNKVLQIVKIANKYLVIAIAKDTISVITELEETDILVKEINKGEKQNFRQILEKLNNKTK